MLDAERKAIEVKKANAACEMNWLRQLYGQAEIRFKEYEGILAADKPVAPPNDIAPLIKPTHYPQWPRQPQSKVKVVYLDEAEARSLTDKILAEAALTAESRKEPFRIIDHRSGCGTSSEDLRNEFIKWLCRYHTGGCAATIQVTG